MEESMTPNVVLPPFLASANNGQQNLSFVQCTFLIGNDVKVFQFGIKEPTPEAVVEALKNLLNEVSALVAKN